MFENELLEKFSRIHPVTPFVVYVPVLSFFAWRTYGRGVPLTSAAGLVFAGLVVWTLTEYLLHRSIFHWQPQTSWGARFHFLAHGVHHDYPNDTDRLVMPLLTSVPLAVIFYTLFYVTVGIRNAEALYVGFAIGYLWYDGGHYAMHHFKPKTALGKWLKHHHMRHHYMDHDGGFGVSSPLWDIIFRTMPVVKKPAPAAKKTA
jgi:sterol desaturase/sphingolipid hydroxylase (fatty acid hydroxylase superfamily)